MAEALLTQAFLRRLEALAVTSARRFAGARNARRQGLHRGTSLEFADYRDYAPGDDLRYVDWNIFARTSRPYVRTYVAEEDLFIYLFLDVSRSMAFGEPGKFDYARRLTAALAYVGLAGLDRVSVSSFDGSLAQVMRSVRGKTSVFPVLDFLEGLAVRGSETSLDRAVRAHTGVARQPGVAVVVSDFLDPSFAEGLRQLAVRRYCVHALQVLSPQEFAPPVDGDLMLEDSETGEELAVSLTTDVRDRYQRTVLSFIDEVKSQCLALGATHTLVRTDRALEQVVLAALRTQGVVG